MQTTHTLTVPVGSRLTHIEFREGSLVITITDNNADPLAPDAQWASWDMTPGFEEGSDQGTLFRPALD